MEAHERRTLPEGWEWKKQLVDVRLFDALFTNFGINASIPCSPRIILNDFINICDVLEKEICEET